MDKGKLISFYYSHQGGINGSIIGFIVAILFLEVGFFKTIFIVIFALAGYYIGKKLSSDKEYIKKLLDRILPPGSYR